MDGDAPLPDCDHFMGQVDEPADHGKGGTRSVREDHVEVLDPELCEVSGTVQLRIEPDDETDVSGGEVREDIPKRAGNVESPLDFGNGAGDGRISGRRRWDRLNRLVLGGGKCDEGRGDPVEISHIDTFVGFISGR